MIMNKTKNVENNESLNEKNITEQLKEMKQKYPEIAKMTMKDIVETNEFETCLEEAYKAAWREIRIYETKLRIISKHPIRILKAQKVFEIDNFRKEYLAIIDKQSHRPAASRQVIASIGSMAYTKTVEMLMKEYDEKKIIEQN